jgi:hypothetical protein
MSATPFGRASLQRGRGLWKMNKSLFEKIAIRSRFLQEWTQWRLQKRKYLDRVTWWEKHVKRKISLFCIHEGTERTRNDESHENIYCECIYDILQCRRQPREKTPILNHLKVKIARIRSKRIQSLPLDTQATTILQGEQLSIFHLLNMRKRSVPRLITSVIDTEGVTRTSTSGIFAPSLCFCNINMTQFR